MKPRKHAEISAKKFGGKWEEYIKFHDWMDHSKMVVADVRHRVLLHSSFGIYLLEQVFGHTFTNSQGRVIDVRDIGEQHVMDDLGWIPSPVDYFQSFDFQDWFGGPVKRTRIVGLRNTNGPVPQFLNGVEKENGKN